MNITQEGEIQKQYWAIGKIAEELELPESCIRFWCDEFELHAHRSDNNHRRFTLADISKLSVIKYLLHTEEYTVAGAKKKLASFKWPINASRVEEEVRRQLVRILTAN